MVDNSFCFGLPSSFSILFFHIYHHKQTHCSLSNFIFFTICVLFRADGTPLDPDSFPPSVSDWVVRKGLSIPSINSALRACWKLLVQPLNTITWHIPTGNRGDQLPTQTPKRHFGSELVCRYTHCFRKPWGIFFSPAYWCHGWWQRLHGDLAINQSWYLDLYRRRSWTYTSVILRNRGGPR